MSVAIPLRAGFVAAVLLCLDPACDQQAGQAGAAAGPAPTAMTGPRVRLARPRHDAGRLVQDEATQTAVTVGNAGDAPLVIYHIAPSRFCSSRTSNVTVAPGASVEVPVVCRSDLHGPMMEQLFIESNDPVSGRASVELVGTVTPLLGLDPERVDLSMASGQPRAAEVRLSGPLGAQANLAWKRPDSPDVQVEPLQTEAGALAGLRVRCTARRPGQHVGNFVLSTGIERRPELLLSWACRVTGTLEVSPSTPYFNLKVSGRKQADIDVRSSQPGFRIQSLAPKGPFTAVMERLGPEHFRVTVTVTEDRIPDESRAVVGTLIIVSNDRTEPRKEVPLFGFGRVAR